MMSSSKTPETHQDATTTMVVERFVPQGEASLAEDAPGWHGGEAFRDDDKTTSSASPPLGPVCWKCHGSGQKPTKPRQEEPARKKVACTVCQGVGRLAAKAAATRDAPGVITKSRRKNTTWCPAGPLAFALQSNENDKWRNMVQRADEGQDVTVELSDESCDKDMTKASSSSTTTTTTTPAWLPRRGEQLCKLNGSWRILQRVGGHRWTTDDCVTAFCAARQVLQHSNHHRQQESNPKRCIQYLDLGTGNASVLQMVLRALLQEGWEVTAKGVEARQEAVELARRSLLFNVGPDFPVEIVHGDFRDIIGNNESSSKANLGTFDLVTGTPPYFRVDFHVHKDSLHVTSAVIREGGMPTARESAPARCEFRGGIEAYACAAAGVVTPDTGRFVVCENYLNHPRVLQAAKTAGLHILRVTKVRGRLGRDPLFAVYVMCKPLSDDAKVRTTEEETLAVRDDKGNWTKEYSDTVFRTLSIPPFDPIAK